MTIFESAVLQEGRIEKGEESEVILSPERLVVEVGLLQKGLVSRDWRRGSTLEIHHNTYRSKVKEKQCPTPHSSGKGKKCRLVTG